jgi:hypothetical protein
MNPDIAIEDLLRMQWYYSMEIAPGVITNGQDHPGGALTREALRRVRFAGRKCIELGFKKVSSRCCYIAVEPPSWRPKRGSLD